MGFLEKEAIGQNNYPLLRDFENRVELFRGLGSELLVTVPEEKRMAVKALAIWVQGNFCEGDYQIFGLPEVRGAMELVGVLGGSVYTLSGKPAEWVDNQWREVLGFGKSAKTRSNFSPLENSRIFLGDVASYATELGFGKKALSREVGKLMSKFMSHLAGFVLEADNEGFDRLLASDIDKLEEFRNRDFDNNQE